MMSGSKWSRGGYGREEWEAAVGRGACGKAWMHGVMGGNAKRNGAPSQSGWKHARELGAGVWLGRTAAVPLMSQIQVKAPVAQQVMHISYSAISPE